jgi:hypothetical protein
MELHQNENLYASKDTIKKGKRCPMEWEKIPDK